MRRDSKYKDGFFLMNFLTFKFESNIVLTMSAIFVKLEGKIIDRRSNPVSGTQLYVDCTSSIETNRYKFTLAPSNEIGAFSISEKTDFKQ